jgi:putative hydrolase of the HAD superfamily
MSALRYGAVLCDLDGVIRHWPATGDVERAHGLPPGSLAIAAFSPSRLNPAITGQITDAQWRAAVASDLGAVCGSAERARAAVNAWSALEPRTDPRVLAWLAQARQAVPVVLVTNATTRLEEDLARQGLSDVADLVVSSARLGVAKPDPRFYARAAAQAGVPAGRCLFIDDTAANAAAASAAGMTGVHYRQFDDLRGAWRESPG